MATVRPARTSAAGPRTIPINDDNSPIKVVNFNGVGGSTVMYTAHWPRLHPSDFKVKTLDGVADDWPIDYDALTPFFEENDRMMGVSGLAGDPRSPLTRPPMPPLPLGRSGAMHRQGHEQARLALVAVRHDGRDHGLRGPGALHQSRPLHAGLRARREGLDRHYLLAGGASAPGSSCETHCRVREITDQRARHGLRRRLLRQGRRRAVPAGRSRRHRLQRRRHAAAAAELGVRPLSGRARQFQRAGRQEPDVPSLCAGLRLCRRADRQQPRAADLPVEQGVLRHRSVARLRARLRVSSSAAASGR